MTRRALVLGGSSYLGAAVVRALAAREIPTQFTYFSRETAGGTKLDVRDAAAVRAVVAEAAPDVLVHAITVGPPRALADITDEDWRYLQDVNVRSAFLACQAFAARAVPGDIVLTATLDGTHPAPAPAHFATTQAAIVGLVRALSKELGPSGIRVNAVVSGVLQGGIARHLDPRLLADYKKYSAMGRTGTADEVARAVVRLALDNRFMTGAVLPVTGGI
jgi:3-oxoacyl-[acyl-carrier protein] reductase